MEPRKQAILTALDKFVRQRAGLEFGNYGDVTSYRAEQRSITKDLHHYRELERYVSWRDSITADMLLEAARSAYSGRLTLKGAYISGYYVMGQHTSVAWHTDKESAEREAKRGGYRVEAALGKCGSDHGVQIEYCTGQYFPTEYRRAACAVLASAIWAAMRANMPAPREPRLTRTHGTFTSEHDNIEGKTPGDWLRSKARAEFGRGIAARWFN